MTDPIVLASTSQIRARLLQHAGLSVEIVAPRIDEDAVKQALLAEGARPRDIADTLAELKAEKVALKRPGAWVIGCDQVLVFENRLISKSSTQRDAIALLMELQGKRHKLLTAAVVYHEGKPVWRHVSTSTMAMQSLAADEIEAYVTHNWDDIAYTVGGYLFEGTGARLFSQVEGDYFAILGLPLIEILSFLRLRGAIGLV